MTGFDYGDVEKITYIIRTLTWNRIFGVTEKGQLRLHGISGANRRSLTKDIVLRNEQFITENINADENRQHVT